MKKYINYFKYFYSHLKYKIFIGIILGILVGVLEGFGFSLLLPLFKVLQTETVLSEDSFGNFRFISIFFNYIGIELNRINILIFIIIAFFIKGIFKFIEGYYSIFIQQLFIIKVRMLCLENLKFLNFKSFLKTDTGRIQNNLTLEASKTVYAYKFFFGIIQNSFFVLIFVILAFVSNFQFTMIIFVLASLTSFIFGFISRKTKELSYAISKNGNEYQRLLIQSITFYKYLQSTNRFNIYSKKLSKSISEIEDGHKNIGVKQSFLSSIKEPLMIFIVVLALIIQFSFFEKDFSLILLSLVFIWKGIGYLMSVQLNLNNFLSNIGSLDNVVEFLKEMQQNKKSFGVLKINKLNSKIDFKDAYFFYNEGDPILKNINLQILKNKTIAFVGESGSGKTTLVNILSGLLPIDSGQMLIDGVDAKEIDMRTFQKRIGYITQEPVIFDDTIFNNVTFWDKKTPENLEKFWIALQKAAIVEMVNELPEKEDAPLGNNGVMISGGQKQRISIARELYKDIDILIMDEATSALDSETERVIQNNIEELKGKYTILIVAHRLSTIKTADEIIVMKKGEIIDKGNFEYLIQNNESFQKMVNLQELS